MLPSIATSNKTKFGDFPPELLHNILRSCSSQDLSYLSRTHTSLRDTAEHVLCSQIYYTVYPIDLTKDKEWTPWAPTEQKSLLHTLTTNLRKASLVKTLHIQLEYTKTRNIALALHSILVSLAEGLQNMPNLVDLRIIYTKNFDPRGRISQVIKSHRFRLHTLFVDHSHDLEGIVSSQPELTLLGIYHIHFDGGILAKVKDLHYSIIPRRHRAATIPKVFLLDCPSRNYDISTVTMLPAFYQSGQVAKTCGEIMSSLINEDPRHHYDKDISNLSISLVGISEENVGLLKETMEVMATCLPIPKFGSCLKINVVDTSMQRPWRDPEFVQRVALFKDIETLLFFFPNMEDARFSTFSSDLESCLNELCRAWPKIHQVRIHNLMRLTIFHGPGWCCRIDYDNGSGQ